MHNFWNCVLVLFEIGILGSQNPPFRALGMLTIDPGGGGSNFCQWKRGGEFSNFGSVRRGVCNFPRPGSSFPGHPHVNNEHSLSSKGHHTEMYATWTVDKDSSDHSDSQQWFQSRKRCRIATGYFGSWLLVLWAVQTLNVSGKFHPDF